MKTTTTKKKSKLKTYVWVSREYNSNSQEGEIICTFKAESLEQLEEYLLLYTSGEEDQIPKSRLKVKNKVPRNFFEAGGFCSDDISFTCIDDKKDMSDWWNASGFGFIKGRKQ